MDVDAVFALGLTRRPATHMVVKAISWTVNPGELSKHIGVIDPLRQYYGFQKFVDAYVAGQEIRRGVWTGFV